MSTNKRYTAVVIGCGKVGAGFEMDSALPKPASHAAALKANPRTELIGLVDPDSAALARAGAYYHTTTYADPHEALAALCPDIVVIATPPATHEAMLELALASGARAVVCEKPVSGSLDSAQRMIDRARKEPAVVVLNHQRRFFPQYIDAKDRIAAGELGGIQQLTAYYSNGLLNNATHTLDAVSFLIAQRAEWAIGVENIKNKTAPFGNNIDGLVGFEGGAVLALQSIDHAAFGAHDLCIVGTRGALVVGQYGYQFTWVPVRDGVTFAGMRELDWAAGTTTLDIRSMLAGTLAHTVACLDGVEQPRSTLEDGYHTMQILTALTESAAQGGARVSI